jgi:DNA polymerase III subunit epsilon
VASHWVKKWFQRKPKHPLLEANEELFLTFDQARPIEECEFVVLDTELTGLNPRRNEIISIGAVRIRDMRIIVGENFHTYVHARKPSLKDSTLIHRITSEQLNTAPGLEEALPEFVEFCGTAVLVGHYLQLDLAFINKAAKRILGGKLQNLCMDCARLAQAHLAHLNRAGVKRISLDDTFQLPKLAREYGLPLFVPHDALEDAMQTAYLFLFLAAKLREHGLVTFRDFRQAAEQGLGDDSLV